MELLDGTYFSIVEPLYPLWTSDTKNLKPYKPIETVSYSQRYYAEPSMDSDLGTYTVFVRVQYGIIVWREPLCQTDTWEQANKITENLNQSWERYARRYANANESM